MKFAFATKLLFAATVLGTGEARLRRVLQGPSTTTGTTTGTSGSTNTLPDPTPPSTSTTGSGTTTTAESGFGLGQEEESPVGTSTSTTTSGTPATTSRTPVQALQGHIGGGTVGEDGIRVLNNIGYALVGYDLIKGNPLDTSGLVRIDLGFRNAIFTPEDYVLMVDRQYYAPRSLNVLECQGCNMHATTRVVDNMGQYVSALKSKVHASASRNNGVTSGSFAGSFDFAQANTMLTQERESSTESEISCCVYQAELQSYDLPPFSRNFQHAVTRLKDAADTEYASRKLQEEMTTDGGEGATATNAEETTAEEAAAAMEGETAEDPTPLTGALLEEIERFIHEFGTHYVKKVTMGSLYGEQTFFSQDQKREMENQGIDIRVAAGVSVATSSGSGGFGLDMNVQQTREFLSRTSRKSVYSRGAKPVGGGDADAWLAYSSDNPVPTYVEVEPIEELDAYDNPYLVQALRQYISTYCQRVTGGECPNYEAGSHMDTSSGPSSTGARFSADQHQPHLRNTITEALGDDAMYDTDATQVFTGLAGDWIEDSIGGANTYSAKVSSLNSDNIHPTGGDIGWTGWSSWAEADMACGLNEAMVGIRVDYALTNSDKRFGLNCASIAGMEVLPTRIRPDGIRVDGQSTIDARDVSTLPWINALQQAHWDFACPLNHVMIGIHSFHNYESDDTRWKIKCASIRPSAASMEQGEVSVTPFWNNFMESFTYSAPPQSVLKGLLGSFNPDNDDSRYSFAEYFVGVQTDGVTFSTDPLLPETLADGEEFEYTCGSQALTGIESGYTAGTAGTVSFGRNFKFECRSVQGHRLVHDNEVTATASSEPEPGDWTGTFVGSGSSFGLSCEGTKILAGVKVKYDAEHNDIGWKGLCLGLVTN